MQQFVNQFEYDLSSMTTTWSFYESPYNTLTGTYIGGASYGDMASPFVALHDTTQLIHVNHDAIHYKTTIGAALGYQGQMQFQASMLGNQVSSWSDDCNITLGGTFPVPCDEAPVYADLYFNDTAYYNAAYTSDFTADYDGYT